MKKIFLSASIPKADRNKEYYDSADVSAIRDSVKALATCLIPDIHLVWGGHPSITPLIRYVIGKMEGDVKEYVSLYQSLFFEQEFIEDNREFENVILTEKCEDIPSSLKLMRNQMFTADNFVAGVFIGGMEGILDEYELFTKHNPNALILILSSTGGATKVLYEKLKASEKISQSNIIFNDRLENDYAYMSLFNELLKSRI